MAASVQGLLSPAILAALTPQAAPQQGLLAAKQPGFWDRLGDSMVGAENTGADRRGLLAQAMLGAAAGMAQTGGQGFMGALGNGLASGLNQLGAGRQQLADERYRQQRANAQDGAPAQQRYLEWLASKVPESERENVFRVAAGVEGRASNAGFSKLEFTGPDGRKRIGVMNGRTGRIDTPDGMSFDPTLVQITGSGAGPDFPVTTAGTGEPVAIDPDIAPWLREKMMQNPDAYAAGGYVEGPEQPAPTYTPAPIRNRPPTSNPGAWVARSPEEEMAAVTAAAERTRLSLLPDEMRIRTDAAVDQAGRTAAATEAAKAEVAKLEKDANFKLYQVAMQGAKEGLEGSATGPLVGRLPAVTASQQTAQGGVAALTPVLKQLFRTAGEGNFTDADQKLLLEMVPTRADLPAARDAKLANIDRIIRAKLGQPDAPSAGDGAAAGPQRTVTRTGTMNGRRVVQYSDGSVEYAD